MHSPWKNVAAGEGRRGAFDIGCAEHVDLLDTVGDGRVRTGR